MYHRNVRLYRGDIRVYHWNQRAYRANFRLYRGILRLYHAFPPGYQRCDSLSPLRIGATGFVIALYHRRIDGAGLRGRLSGRKITMYRR